MSCHDTECVICGKETTKRVFNEYYDQWESLCHDSDCEKRFYRETQATINVEQL